GVRANPLPGRDHRPDSVLLPRLAEVRAPRPAHDHGVHWVCAGVDAELPVAVEGDRPHVALVEAVGGDQVEGGRAQLFLRVRARQVQQTGRVVDALGDV